MKGLHLDSLVMKLVTSISTIIYRGIVYISEEPYSLDRLIFGDKLSITSHTHGMPSKLPISSPIARAEVCIKKNILIREAQNLLL